MSASYAKSVVECRENLPADLYGTFPSPVVQTFIELSLNLVPFSSGCYNLETRIHAHTLPQKYR